jgi:hypothetical protein
MDTAGPIVMRSGSSRLDAAPADAYSEQPPKPLLITLLMFGLIAGTTFAAKGGGITAVSTSNRVPDRRPIRRCSRCGGGTSAQGDVVTVRGTRSPTVYVLPSGSIGTAIHPLPIARTTACVRSELDSRWRIARM